MADVRLALRGLRRNPLFATVAILSLALGIGANTAIFTLIDQMLLRKLPVKAPDELVMLYQQGPHNGSNMGGRMHSYPIYQDYQSKAEPLAEVACRRLVPASVSIDNQTERVTAEMVSGNYFTMLGVPAAAGRVFNSKEDDQAYQGHPVVVLGYDYWVNRFARDPGVIGRKILVNNSPMTIIGVSAQGFAGLDPTQSAEIRVPIQMKPVMVPDWTWVHMDDRRTRWVQVFARLKPGYTVESARAPLQGLFTQIRTYESTLPAAKDWSAYRPGTVPEGSTARGPRGDGLLESSKPVLDRPHRPDVHGRPRAAHRVRQRRESAHRQGLHAAEGDRAAPVARRVPRPAREAAARREPAALVSRRPCRALPRRVPDAGAAGADSGRGIAAADQPAAGRANPRVQHGADIPHRHRLWPASRAPREPARSVVDAERHRRIDCGNGRVAVPPQGTVAAQVALSFLLLFGAGLFVRSLQNLKTTDTGVALENLVTFQLSPDLSGYNDQRGTIFYRDLVERLRSAPGVKSAAIANVPILSGDEWDSTMSVEGHRAADGEDMQAFMNALSPGYFETMRIPILEGRDFTQMDVKERSEPSAPNVAIVNRRFAEHFFKGKSAVGNIWAGETAPTRR